MLEAVVAGVLLVWQALGSGGLARGGPGTLERRTAPAPSLSSYFGGSGYDDLRLLAETPDGDLILCGQTQSRDLPTTPGAFQRSFGGESWTRGFGDVYVARLSGDGRRLRWATYVGGSGGEEPFALVLGASGAIWVAGRTRSADFPRTKDALPPAKDPWNETFVFALDGSGGRLLYSTTFGGYGGDIAHALAVDEARGLIYLAGMTNGGVPVTGNAYQRKAKGRDAFVAILDRRTVPGSTRVAYATFLGGAGDETRVFDLRLERDGSLWLTGRTRSGDFPTTGGAIRRTAPRGGDALFLAHLDPRRAGLQGLLYATYLGGGGEPFAARILADSGGALVVAGSTAARDWPTTAGAWQVAYGGGKCDGFVARIDPAKAGSAGLTFATYVGGDGIDLFPSAVRLPGGRIALAGASSSQRLRGTTGAFQETRVAPGSTDAFVFVLDLAAKGASQEAYASYFAGGAGGSEAKAALVDARGHLVFGGTTKDPRLPAQAGAYQPHLKLAPDAFVAAFELSAMGPAVQKLGRGCGLGARPPLLEAAAAPRLGLRCELRARGVAAGAIGVLLTGFSRERWASLRLPLDLGAAGMPGCTLHASGEVVDLLRADGQGSWAFGFPVPWRPELVGLHFYVQYAFRSKTANPLGLALTNALDLEVRY